MNQINVKKNSTQIIIKITALRIHVICLFKHSVLMKKLMRINNLIQSIIAQKAAILKINQNFVSSSHNLQ